MAHDVFISYATSDRPVAEKVCDALEEGGVKCWIAPRDVPFGADYAEAIVDAITSSRLVVLILSSHSNDSPHVKREVENAYADNSGRAVLPLRIENVTYNKTLQYFLAPAQWLDASTPPLEQHLGRIVEQVRARLGLADDASQVERPATDSDRRTTPTAIDPPRPPDDTHAHVGLRPGRKPPLAVWIAAGLGALVLVVVVASFVTRSADNVNTLPRNVNANVNASATPTPQRTTTPTPTPNASPSPTPRVTIRPGNLNLRRNR